MKIEYDGNTTDYHKSINIYRLMENLSLNKEAYLAVVNGQLVTEDYRAVKGDEVKFIKVVSGG